VRQQVIDELRKALRITVDGVHYSHALLDLGPLGVVKTTRGLVRDTVDVLVCDIPTRYELAPRLEVDRHCGPVIDRPGEAVVDVDVVVAEHGAGVAISLRDWRPGECNERRVWEDILEVPAYPLRSS
jgi:hypothetical protein